MKRRDVLLLRPPEHRRDARAHEASASAREVELSCERLYMRYVDAEAEGKVDALFEAVAREVRGARAIRLTDTEWLAHAQFKAALDGVLAKSATTEDTQDKSL